MNLRSAVHALSGDSSGPRLLTSMCAGAIVVAALTVSFASLATAASGFSDVPAGHQYHAAITDLASRSVIGGYDDGRFGPGDPVTRQQFAKMIVLTGGYPVSEADICTFTDVAKSGAGTFFPDNYIAVCAARGITTGATVTTFNPSGKITRHQVLSMVVRTTDDLQPGLLAVPPAGWTGVAAWANDPTHGANAARAEYNGLLAGLALFTLDPSQSMNRGEVAQVLRNLLGTLTSGSTTPATKPPAEWTDLRPVGNVPSTRGGHAMVYDSVKRKAILFGGTHVGDERTTLLNDTWAYTAATNTWTDLRPAGVPPARTYFSLVYDPGTRKVLLFGGQDWLTFFHDTWAYDSATNTWTELRPTGVPPARAYSSMVYDPGTGEVILFGGRTTSGAGVRLNDIWAYDPVANSWTELRPAGNPPPARCFHSMVYDSAGKKVIMFGGSGAAGLLNDTWAYDPALNTWTKLHPSGNLPPVREGHSMVYDQGTGKVILGGRASVTSAAEEPVHLADMWAFDAAAHTWTELRPAGSSPPARLSYPVVYDSAGGRVILFGGYGYGDGGLSDTWAYGS